MDDGVKSCCAGFYDLPVITLLLGNELHPGGAALTRKLAAATLVGRDARLLDVACGRGESARVLAAHFGCRVVGVDYSAENVALANELTEDADLSDGVDFVQGDAEQLPFGSESFDVVICECSLCIFPQLAAALNEIQRVLRPGGRVGISDVVLNEPVPESLQDLVGRALCISGALSIAGYRNLLVATGFSAIRTRDVSKVLSDMIARIERGVGIVEDYLDRERFTLEDSLGAPLTTIAEARDFVMSGGAGYVLITGRKLPASCK